MEFFVIASLGSWSTSIFEFYAEATPPRVFMRDFGVYFVITFNFINVLILLNVVIALMADTYSLMSGVRKGLYNYSIVKTVPSYKLDNYYGGMVCLMYPFNLFTFILTPYWICVSDRKRLKAFNDRVYDVAYFFVTIIISAVFIAFNLVMLPFAFLKNCVHKVNLLRHNKIECSTCFGYFLLGLPLLLIAQITDLWSFIVQSNNRRKIFQSD